MKKKSFMSILLAVLMVLTISGTSVFATEDVAGNAGTDDVIGTTEAPAEEEVTEPTDENTEAEEVTPEDTENVDADAAFTVTATAGDQSVTLSWANIDGVAASEYAITVNGETSTVVPAIGDTNTTANITGLTNGTAYTFVVSYSTQEGTVTGSATATATPKAPITLSKITTPKTVSGNKAIRLKWKPATTDKTVNSKLTYIVHIYKYVNGKAKKVGDYKVSGSKLGSVCSGYLVYDKKNLLKETNYYFYVYVDGYKAATKSPTVKDQTVRQAYVRITLKMNKTLTSHDGKNKTRTFKAGTKIYTDGFGSGKYRFHDSNGYYFYVMRVATKNAKGIYTTKWNYTKEEAEYYINSKGYTSKTSKLIWVSEYCQRLYMFEKKSGEWSCIHTWDISTGKPSTPSPTGLKKIIRKIYYRHGIHWWSCYSSYNALHGVHNGWEKKLGTMQSGGCIRNDVSNAKIIYKTCPNGTTVWVY